MVGRKVSLVAIVHIPTDSKSHTCAHAHALCVVHRCHVHVGVGGCTWCGIVGVGRAEAAFCRVLVVAILGVWVEPRECGETYGAIR